MSRIVGFLTKSADRNILPHLEKMLQGVKSNPAWRSSQENFEHCAIGWSGWKDPCIERSVQVLIAMDGHIYNRRELDKDGKHNSDTSLFISLYLKMGFEKALHKINGDFAIALYDRAEDSLWLGRDRFGIRPLYFSSKPGYFAFASRPRPLLSLPGVSRVANRSFVARFAASHYRCIDNDPMQSPYTYINQLPAAHWIRVKGGVVQQRRYWTVNSDLPDFTGSEEELAIRYRDLMVDAVSLRLQATDRPAFTLSGGMDSSSVLASAVHWTGKKQHAFTTVYEDPTYDESVEIRSMFDTAVEEWHTIRIGRPDLPLVLSRMIADHDEPVATATWLSHYLLCQKVRELGFNSLLGGLGGDELNAGEYEYFLFFFADLRAGGQEDLLKGETEKWVEYHDHPVFRKNRSVMEEGLTRLVDLSRPGVCLPNKQRQNRYLKVLQKDFWDLERFEPIMDHPFPSYLKNRTWQDITRETAPCCLRAEDRQTVAFDLDNFLPFFDHRLVEFMFRVPGSMKIRDGVTKRLLREAMRGILPEETRTRVKKTGWNAPAHIWFSGPGKEWVFDLIYSQAFRERSIYNQDEVVRLLEDHDRIVSTASREDNHMMFFWQLVNLELWHRWLEGR